MSDALKYGCRSGDKFQLTVEVVQCRSEGRFEIKFNDGLQIIVNRSVLAAGVPIARALQVGDPVKASAINSLDQGAFGFIIAIARNEAWVEWCSSSGAARRSNVRTLGALEYDPEPRSVPVSEARLAT